jgi:hypothetical protein
MNIVEQPSPQEVAESENKEYSRGRKRITGRRNQGANNSAIGDGAPMIESRAVSGVEGILVVATRLGRAR